MSASLNPWTSRAYKTIIKDYCNFNHYCNNPLCKDDSKVFIRFTSPTWKRRGEIAIAVLPNYPILPYRYGKHETSNNDWDIEPSDFMCIFFPTAQNKLNSFYFYEPSMDLAVLKADILASEKGYIIPDVFNFPILQKDA